MLLFYGAIRKQSIHDYWQDSNTINDRATCGEIISQKPHKIYTAQKLHKTPMLKHEEKCNSTADNELLL
jgi:NAD-dependent dihydropyrimidine dehydrogenase PreA subunit